MSKCSNITLDNSTFINTTINMFPHPNYALYENISKTLNYRYCARQIVLTCFKDKTLLGTSNFEAHTRRIARQKKKHAKVGPKIFRTYSERSPDTGICIEMYKVRSIRVTPSLLADLVLANVGTANDMSHHGMFEPIQILCQSCFSKMVL